MKHRNPHNTTISSLFLLFGFLFIQACGMSGDTESESLTEGVQSFGFIGASNLENDGFMSLDPQIAVEGDGGGTAIAVWLKQVDSDPFDDFPPITHLYARRHNGASWISTDAACPVDGRLENNDADGICLIDVITETESADHPRISMDDNGDAMVVWEQNDGATGRIYARFFDASPTPTWGAAVELNGTSDYAGLNAAAPSIALEPDGGGTAMATWSQAATVQTLGSWAKVLDYTQFVGAMAEFDGKLYAGMGTTVTGGADICESSDPGVVAWTCFDDPLNTAVPPGYQEVRSLVVFDNKLYAGLRDTVVGQTRAALRINNTGGPAADWGAPIVMTTLPGAAEAYEAVNAMASFGGFLYVGMGATAGADSDVFRCSVASGCDAPGDFARVFDGVFTEVLNMIVYNNQLYIGLGSAAGQGDIWRCTVCDGSDWVQVLTLLPHDGTNPASVRSMAVHNGALYVGFGDTLSLSDIVRCTNCGAGGDWTTILDSSSGLSAPVSQTEQASAMVSFEGTLYAGFGISSGSDAIIVNCKRCDGTDNGALVNFISLTGTAYDQVRSIAVFKNELYAGLGNTGAEGDVFKLPINPSAVPQWTTAARRFAAGAWATTDAATGCAPGDYGGTDDGICIIGGLGGIAYDGPVIGMDSAGRAITAFIRQEITATGNPCQTPIVVPDSSGTTQNGTDTGPISCWEARLYVNQFDGANWLGVLNISGVVPVSTTVTVSPTSTTSTTGGTNDKICYNTGSGGPNGGENGFTPDGENIGGENSACVTILQPQISVNRVNGQSMVVAKTAWNETEAAGGCSNDEDILTGQGSTVDSDDEHGRPTGNNDCDPSGIATDEFNGDAIMAIKYDGTGWAATDWTKTFLYAHTDNPIDAACDGQPAGTCNSIAGDKPLVSNCSSTVTSETGRLLLNCKVNAPQVAISGDANGTALAVFERFDGTNYDIYADCFSLGGNTCGSVELTGTCTDGTFNNGWRSKSCAGATFRGNGFVPAPAGDCSAAGCASFTPADANVPTVTTPWAVLNSAVGSRRAFSPKVAIDSTGNGRAVWAEKNPADQQWRIYSMQFVSGTGFTASETIDSYSGGNLTYSNPTISMEWQNAGNAPSCPAGVNCGSAWTLFLESDLSTLSSSSTITTMNVQVRANKWIPP